MRIKTLEIRDFKAFWGTHTLSLTQENSETCKNLLVLGENGSGKTSLVKAIDGALGASRWGSRFEKNVFAQAGGGYVKIELSNGKWCLWQENGIGVTGVEDETLFSDAAKAKRLMDYKGLLKTYLLETETVNLFDLLLREVLADCTNPITNGSFLEDWQALAKLIPRQNTEKQVKVLQEALNVFNDSFSITLQRMTTRAQAILHEFDDALEFDLTFSGVLYEAASKTLKGREVWLTARFHGQDLTRHHHLLNEARLSSIALSLYFAALLETPQAELKVLMLDDVLIGLDMENRLPVLKVLERPEFADYQVFMLTYDPIWFEIVRGRTPQEQWKYISVRLPKNVRSVTPIIEEGGYLGTAQSHFAAGDYPAAGNYTRKAFEQGMQDFFQEMNIPIKYRANPHKLSSEDFWQALLKWQKLGLQPLDAELKLLLLSVRSVVLNPLSHAEIQALSRREVGEAIDVIRRINTAFKKVLEQVKANRSSTPKS